MGDMLQQSIVEHFALDPGLNEVGDHFTANSRHSQLKSRVKVINKVL